MYPYDIRLNATKHGANVDMGGSRQVFLGINTSKL